MPRRQPGQSGNPSPLPSSTLVKRCNRRRTMLDDIGRDSPWGPMGWRAYQPLPLGCQGQMLDRDLRSHVLIFYFFWPPPPDVCAPVACLLVCLHLSFSRFLRRGLGMTSVHPVHPFFDAGDVLGGSRRRLSRRGWEEGEGVTDIQLHTQIREAQTRYDRVQGTDYKTSDRCTII